MELNRELVGFRIKTVREKVGLSQKLLAEKVEISPPALNRFEKGIKSPSLETLLKIASALGVSLDFLTGATADEELFIDSDIKEAFENFKQLSQENRQHIMQNIRFLRSK